MNHALNEEQSAEQQLLAKLAELKEAKEAWDRCHRLLGGLAPNPAEAVEAMGELGALLRARAEANPVADPEVTELVLPAVQMMIDAWRMECRKVVAL